MKQPMTQWPAQRDKPQWLIACTYGRYDQALDMAVASYWIKRNEYSDKKVARQ